MNQTDLVSPLMVVIRPCRDTVRVRRTTPPRSDTVDRIRRRETEQGSQVSLAVAQCSTDALIRKRKGMCCCRCCCSALRVCQVVSALSAPVILHSFIYISISTLADWPTPHADFDLLRELCVSHVSRTTSKRL